jgi:hypothetical protein
MVVVEVEFDHTEEEVRLHYLSNLLEWVDQVGEVFMRDSQIGLQYLFH